MQYLKIERRSLSTETVSNYLEYSKEACLHRLVPRRNLSGKEILSSQEKIFIADHGIRQSIFLKNQGDINQVLENTVCLELLRRGYSVTIGKTRTQEIDPCTQNEEGMRYIRCAVFWRRKKLLSVNSASTPTQGATIQSMSFPSTSSIFPEMASSMRTSSTGCYPGRPADRDFVFDGQWACQGDLLGGAGGGCGLWIPLCQIKVFHSLFLGTSSKAGRTILTFTLCSSFGSKLAPLRRFSGNGTDI